MGEYTGEIIDLDEADSREMAYNEETTGHMSCIIHVDMGKGAKFAVDATRAGSVLRFLNHSCDPNLELVACFVGERFPRLAFFTKKAIRKGEQITFCYDKLTHKGGMKCLCGASNCKRFF